MIGEIPASSLGFNHDYYISITHRSFCGRCRYQSHCISCNLIIQYSRARWLSTDCTCHDLYGLILRAWICSSLFVGSTTDNKFTTFAGRGLEANTSTLSQIFLIRCNNILNVLIHWADAAIWAKRRALTISGIIIFLVNGRLFEIYLIWWLHSGILLNLLWGRWVIWLIQVFNVVHGIYVIFSSPLSVLIRVDSDVWNWS